MTPWIDESRTGVYIANVYTPSINAIAWRRPAFAAVVTSCRFRALTKAVPLGDSYPVRNWAPPVGARMLSLPHPSAAQRIIALDCGCQRTGRRRSCCRRPASTLEPAPNTAKFRDPNERQSHRGRLQLPGQRTNRLRGRPRSPSSTTSTRKTRAAWLPIAACPGVGSDTAPPAPARACG